METESNRTAPAKRDPFPDFIKGIAICLVVLGHSIQYGSGAGYLAESRFYDDPLFSFLYSFHMPLFMLVSGYLFRGTVMRRSSGSVCKRLLSGLIVPCACWTVLYASYRFFVSGVKGTAKWEILTNLPREIRESHWFLWAVFWCSLIVLLVHHAGKDRPVFYFTLFFLFLLLPNRRIPNLYLYVFMFPYFTLGYFAAKKGISLPRGRRAVIAFALLGVLFAVLLPFYSKDAFVYTTGISLTETPTFRQLFLDTYRFVIGFVGSAFAILAIYGLFCFCRKRANFVFRSVLYLGRRTLGIYVIGSYLNFELLVRFTAGFSPHFGIHLLESALILVLSVTAVFGIEHIPLLRRLLLGGR